MHGTLKGSIMSASKQLRDKKGQFAGSIGGGKTPPQTYHAPEGGWGTGPSGLSVDRDLPPSDPEATWREYRFLTTKAMRENRKKDVAKSAAYYETQPRLTDLADQSKRELEWLEEDRAVDYTYELEGSEVVINVDAPAVPTPITIRLFMPKSKRVEDVVEDYLAKNGAYWACKTPQDLERDREETRQITRDTNEYGAN
jgi:hypothetical protein